MVTTCHESTHQNNLDGILALQMKVSKLKKDRCLDAQRLEEFYSKNQQLRENQKSLHDTIKVLEDRLRAGLCDRCAVTEEHMRKKQQEFENIRQQNLKLITELMNEKNSLQDENKRFSEQLQQLQLQTEGNYEEAAAKEVDSEDGVIPDSPLHSFTHPIASRMRRKKEHRHVRYVEHTGPNLEPSECTHVFGKPIQSSTQIQMSKRDEILVADTCDQDVPTMINQRIDNYPSEKPAFNLAAVVAETLGLGVQEDSDSESVLSSRRGSPSRTLAQQTLSERDSSAPFDQESFRSNDGNIGYEDSSQEIQDGAEWAHVPASPVFGAPPVTRDSPERDMSSSPSLLGPGRKVNTERAPSHNTSDFRTLKGRSKSEDVALVAPLVIGPEVKTVLSQSSASRHMVLKRSTSELFSCTSPSKDDSTENNDFYMASKRLGGRGEKRKNEESPESDSCCEKTFNKENNLPVRAYSNADNSVDKPLDLSDRFSAVRSKETNHTRGTCKAKLKQSTLYDTLQQVTKPYNGSYKGTRDFTEDLCAEVTHELLGKTTSSEKTLQREDSYSFKTAALLKGASDSDQLFDEVKVTGVPGLARKKTKTEKKVCEPASVLQLNPCLANPKNKSLEKEQGKPSLENMQWSIDPGADLSQYKMDVTMIDTKEENHTKPVGEDMDNTYINESMLFRVRKQETMGEDCPDGRNANDSLEEMFDRTAYGEYESCVAEQSPPEMGYQSGCDEEDGEDHELSRMENHKVKKHEEKRDTTKQRAFVEPYIKSDERKKGYLDFPHIEVVRNKEERRKMLGHTCKECEIYYADLPDEERAQKLASCSRHRFRYIPPSTPENFWEVGFPTTQICKDRGYIKEEHSPCQRPRRRQPYNAIFAPKGKEQKT
ncbi:hypothetical protein NDU88_000465 [Pleurodeles waltl]|uniref:DNA endonuclease RBBP8 n=1 Tax=Pleurodeles waltl TaxID=8319 RepID=A0AAV7UQ14_PLEWA|nr:hypothetical protein NDU88_000465 [Pleurodeles waltl]